MRFASTASAPDAWTSLQLGLVSAGPDGQERHPGGGAAWVAHCRGAPPGRPLRQSAAVERNEVTGPISAVLMEAAGHQFLAGTRLTNDQNARRRVSQIEDQTSDLSDRGRATDQGGFDVTPVGQRRLLRIRFRHPFMSEH